MPVLIKAKIDYILNGISPLETIERCKADKRAFIKGFKSKYMYELNGIRYKVGRFVWTTDGTDLKDTRGNQIPLASKSRHILDLKQLNEVNIDFNRYLNDVNNDVKLLKLWN